MKYTIQTFGCQMNARDAETAATLLEDMGYSAAAAGEPADLILLITCCVRENAERRIAGRIGELKREKDRVPGALLAVGGCLPQQAGAALRLAQRHPHVDLVFGTHNLHRLPELLTMARHSGPVVEVCEPGEVVEDLPARRQVGLKAFVNVSHGCDNYCSYCVVPYVRGPERSREPGAVLAEIERLVAGGAREVILLGQNVNSYGRDLAGAPTFADLLRRAGRIPGLSRIRFTTSHPRDLSDDLIAALATEPAVMEHLHLPVQSGSDRILEAMGRGYTRGRYLERAAAARLALPGLALTTDIIVGFPGETEDDFADTLSLVEEVGFEAAFTFAYSKRTGTPAAALPGQVPDEVKRERLGRLNGWVNGLANARNQRLVGSVVEVLVEGPQPELLVGRSRTNHPVHFPGDPSLAGSLAQVLVEEARTWTLHGRLLARHGE